MQQTPAVGRVISEKDPETWPCRMVGVSPSISATRGQRMLCGAVWGRSGGLGGCLRARIYSEPSCLFYLHVWFCGKAPASQDPVRFVLPEGTHLRSFRRCCCCCRCHRGPPPGWGQQPASHMHTHANMHTCVRTLARIPPPPPRVGPSCASAPSLPAPHATRVPLTNAPCFTPKLVSEAPSLAPNLENQTPFLPQRTPGAGLGVKTFV